MNKPEDFEWKEEFFEPSLDNHLNRMREGGLNKLADFIKWFIEQNKTYKGVITNFNKEMFAEQDFYEPERAAAYALAIMAGTEWEREEPSPENRDDVNKQEVLNNDTDEHQE